MEKEHKCDICGEDYNVWELSEKKHNGKEMLVCKSCKELTLCDWCGDADFSLYITKVEHKGKTYYACRDCAEIALKWYNNRRKN